MIASLNNHLPDWPVKLCYGKFLITNTNFWPQLHVRKLGSGSSPLNLEVGQKEESHLSSSITESRPFNPSTKLSVEWLPAETAQRENDLVRETKTRLKKLREMIFRYQKPAPKFPHVMNIFFFILSRFFSATNFNSRKPWRVWPFANSQLTLVA